MYEALKLTRMIKGLEQTFEKFPEHRRGKNSQYEIADAGMGAFSVFFVLVIESLDTRVLYKDESKTCLLSSNHTAAAETAL